MDQVSDLHAQLAAEQARGAEAVAAVREEAAARLAEKEEMVGTIWYLVLCIWWHGAISISLYTSVLNQRRVALTPPHHPNRWRR